MGFDVKLYKFAKKVNSTAVPTNSALIKTVQCNLKAPCNVMSPVLVFDFAPNENTYPDYNYIYIPDFHRYYFISSWVATGKMWVASLSIDVLASYKSAIGRQELYCLRTTYTSGGNKIYDGSILDTSYPTTAQTPTFRHTAFNNPLSSGGGCYIVGVVNGSTNYGSVSYYAFSSAQYARFMDQVVNHLPDWSDISVTEMSTAVQKALINPMQYIVSSMWLPYYVANTTYGILTTNIQVGFWPMANTQGYLIRQGQAIGLTNNIRVPTHPQSDTRGNYLNLAPYSSYTLRYYPFGTIGLDSEAVAYSGASGYVDLTCAVHLDLITGIGILNIYTASFADPIRTIQAQVGVDIPTANVSVNWNSMSAGIGAITQVANNISNFEVGSAVTASQAAIQLAGGKVHEFFAKLFGKDTSDIEATNEYNKMVLEKNSGVSSGVASTSLACMATCEIQGQQGCISGYTTQGVSLTGRFLPVADEDYDMVGRPYCHIIRINSLSGYILVREADLGDIAIPEDEKNMIRTFLINGFFYE